MVVHSDRLVWVVLIVHNVNDATCGAGRDVSCVGLNPDASLYDHACHFFAFALERASHSSH